MIRFDFMNRKLNDFKATFDLILSSLIFFFRWRLSKGQTHSFHTQITAPNNERTALKDTRNVFWDTLKSLDFSSDSARLASPSALIPFRSPPARSTPSARAKTPTLNATAAVMTPTPTSCHVMSLFAVASHVLHEAAKAEILTGLDSCVTSLSIRDEEKAGTFPSYSHWNRFQRQNTKWVFVGLELLLKKIKK